MREGVNRATGTKGHIQKNNGETLALKKKRAERRIIHTYIAAPTNKMSRERACREWPVVIRGENMNHSACSDLFAASTCHSLSTSPSQLPVPKTDPA